MSPTTQFLEHDSPAEVESVSLPKQRVLHIINGEHYAGAERVQDLLGLRLGEFGYEAGFACMKPGQFPALRQCVQQPLYEIPMRGRGDLRPALAIARLVRREGYSLIHTHTARSAIIGRIAAGLSGVPMVHHVHSPASADTTYRWREPNQCARRTPRTTWCRGTDRRFRGDGRLRPQPSDSRIQALRRTQRGAQRRNACAANVSNGFLDIGHDRAVAATQGFGSVARGAGSTAGSRSSRAFACGG